MIILGVLEKYSFTDRAYEKTWDLEKNNETHPKISHSFENLKNFNIGKLKDIEGVALELFKGAVMQII